MLEGFDKHYRLFRAASREAKARFERADWQAVREAHAARILFYDERVHEAEEYLRREFNTDALPDALWQEIKLQYVGLLTNYRQPELAETFFNTVSCRILQRTYYNNDFMFVRPAVSTEYMEGDPPSYRSYYPLEHGLRTVLRQIFRDLDLKRTLRRPGARHSLCAAIGARSFAAPVAAGGQPPDPGAELAVLSQQARLSDRQDHQRQRSSCRLRCRSCTRTAARVCAWMHACWTQPISPCCSHSAAPISWSTWKCLRLTSIFSRACCRASRKRSCIPRSDCRSMARRSSIATSCIT